MHRTPSPIPWFNSRSSSQPRRPEVPCGDDHPPDHGALAARREFATRECAPDRKCPARMNGAVLRIVGTPA